MDERWNDFMTSIKGCEKCGLCAARSSIVVGDGNPESKIMFIGEGPGAEEDYQGVPFVGPAGQLLDRMIAAIGINRTNCYIANIVKCRPPGNRAPSPEEAAACLPYLREQVRIIRPQIIVALGSTAAQNTISPSVRITRDRGIWHERRGYWMIATFHPSYLLRDATQKTYAWADLKAVRDKARELGITLSREEQ